MKRKSIVLGAVIGAPLLAAAAVVWALAPGQVADSGDRSGEHLLELQALVGTQTPEQIEAVSNGGGQVFLLLDPATGHALAALRADD